MAKVLRRQTPTEGPKKSLEKKGDSFKKKKFVEGSYRKGKSSSRAVGQDSRRGGHRLLERPEKKAARNRLKTRRHGQTLSLCGQRNRKEVFRGPKKGVCLKKKKKKGFRRRLRQITRICDQKFGLPSDKSAHRNRICED